MDTTTAIAVVILTAMVVGIPLLGLTIRLSVKPLVDAWTRLRDPATGSAAQAELHALKTRVAALEAVLEAHNLYPALPERRGASNALGQGATPREKV